MTAGKTIALTRQTFVGIEYIQLFIYIYITGIDTIEIKKREISLILYSKW